MELNARSTEKYAQENVRTYLKDTPDDPEKVINVVSKEFGAVGDGKKDDSKAIQKAMDKAKKLGGGIVFFPRGTYRTTLNINLYSNTSISGKDAAVIKDDSKKDYSVFVIGTNQHDVVIEGLAITNKRKVSGIGIDFSTGASNVWIQGNKFSGQSNQSINMNALRIKHVQISDNQFNKVSYGILTNKQAKDLTDVRVLNNQFIDIYSDGIELNHPGTVNEAGENFVISGNFISVPKGVGTSKGAGFGIGIAGASNITIIGNIIDKARYEAIHIEDEANHILITGNIINSVQNDPDVGLNSGIYIIDGDFITISNNTVKQADDYGIHLEYATDKQASNVIITGNTLTGNKKGGMRVSSFREDSNIIVSQNIVTDNFGDGMRVDGEIGNLKLTDNIFDNNKGYGIYVMRSGPGWFISGNSFTGNEQGNIGISDSVKTPVPIRTQTVVIKSQTSAIVDEGYETPLENVFSLGSGADGVLYVSVKQGKISRTEMYKINWDGASLTQSNLAADADGDLAIKPPLMNGSQLQLQAVGEKDGNIDMEVHYEGMIMLK
nr:right-handed parallel beta-helix repeat-containing protein [Paenibacillus sacheonensis]